MSFVENSSTQIILDDTRLKHPKYCHGKAHHGAKQLEYMKYC